MRLFISDEKLQELLKRARAQDQDSEYWARSVKFLSGLRNRNEVSLKEHNWLSQIRASLKEPWE